MAILWRGWVAALVADSVRGKVVWQQQQQLATQLAKQMEVAVLGVRHSRGINRCASREPVSSTWWVAGCQLGAGDRGRETSCSKKLLVLYSAVPLAGQAAALFVPTLVLLHTSIGLAQTLQSTTHLHVRSLKVGWLVPGLLQVLEAALAVQRAEAEAVAARLLCKCIDKLVGDKDAGGVGVPSWLPWAAHCGSMETSIPHRIGTEQANHSYTLVAAPI